MSVLRFDSSTDGGASVRNAERLQDCCAQLGGGGIAPDDLHKWADVLDLSISQIGASALKRQPDAPPPQTQCSADAPPLSEPKEGR